MVNDPKELELHDVVKEAIAIRLREFRVEDNLQQIYFPPPEPKEFPEAATPEDRTQTLPPAEFPADPEIPQELDLSPETPPEAPQQPVGENGVASPLRAQEALRGESGALDVSAPDGIGAAGEFAVSLPSAPEAVDTPEVAHVPMWNPPMDAVRQPRLQGHEPLGAAAQPAGIPAEPRDVAGAVGAAMDPLADPGLAETFGPEPRGDVGPRAFAGEAGAAGQDPASGIPERAEFVNPEQLQGEVVRELTRAATPLVVEAVQSQIAMFQDSIDEAFHRLDSRFTV